MSIAAIAGWVMATAFRVGALGALACVLVFPAVKRMWIGYVPVAAGAAAAWLCVTPVAPVARARKRLAGRLASVPEGRFHLALLCAAAAIQFLLLLALQPWPAQDSYYVFREAKAFVETGRMSPFTYYPPAQTWWYAAFFRLFGANFAAAQLSQIPLALAAVALAYRLAKRLAEPVRARAAAVALALYPSFIAYILTTPYYYYLYVVFLLAMVLLWVSGRGRSPGIIAAFLAGIAGAGAALTKAVMLVAPLLTAVFLFAATGDRRREPGGGGEGSGWPGVVRGLLAFCVGFALTLAPWVGRNHRVFGEVVPVCTSGGFVLYSANNPASNGLFSGLPDQLRVNSAKEMLEQSRWCSGEAVRFIRADPRRFLRLVGRKFVYTWGTEATFAALINRKGQYNPWLDRLFSFAFHAGWSALVVLWSWSAVGRLRARRPPDVPELAVAIIALTAAAVYSVFEGGARHHLEVVPLLLVFVCLGAAERRSGSAGV